MLLQSGFIPEVLVTLGALEGPLPHVNGLVREQAALHVVAPLALATLETLLPTQDRPGPPDLRAPSGFALVLGILRGLALGVVPSVFCQVSLFMEDLPADRAGVRTQPWWNFQVT